MLCPGLIRTAILDAERNRPAEFGPATDLDALAPDVRAWASGFRSALAGGYEPSQVADAVAQAILEDRYYIVPAQPFLLELIRTRNWIDIPVRFASGRRGIIAFEKGPSGDLRIAEGFDSWR